MAGLANLLDSDELLFLNIDHIEPNEEQDRTDWDSPEAKAELELLARSMSAEVDGKKIGCRTPIIVEKLGPKRYRIIAGERRWRAARIAGLTQILSLVRAKGSPAVLDSMDMLIENILHRPLNTWEQAVALDKRLKGDPDNGIPPIPATVLAQIVGKSKSWVSRETAVLKMPEDVRQLCKDRVVEDVETLRELTKHEPETRAAMIAELRKGGQAKVVVMSRKKPRQSKEQTTAEAPASKQIRLNVEEAAALLRRLGVEVESMDPQWLRDTLLAQT